MADKKRASKFRRLGVAAVIVSGAGGAVATFSTTADAVPSCTAAKYQGSIETINKYAGTNLRLCEGGALNGQIPLQKIAESRNPLAKGNVSLPNINFPGKLP